MRKVMMALLVLGVGALARSEDADFEAAKAALGAKLEASIAAGAKERKHDFSLDLQDTGRGLMRGLMAMNGDRPTIGEGYSLRVFTPLMWISQQASAAATEYRTFGVGDVTPDDLRAVLRVIVKPDVPTGALPSDGASVKHVVLRDAKKRQAVQPLNVEKWGVEAKNNLGASFSYEGVVAEFDLSQVAQLQAADSKGEFFVTVVGLDGADKDFKIKEKHIKRLVF
jgi:hypothetical protein